MSSTTGWRIAGVALAVLPGLALAGPLPAALLPLIWLALFWMPGTLLAPWDPGGEPSGGTGGWRSLAYGPVVTGFLVLGGRALGLPLGVAAWMPALVSGLVLAGRGPRPRWQGGSRPLLPLLLVAGGILLLGVLPALLHEPLRLRDDARLHLPLAGSLLLGSFPPENPFLAGAEPGYFWFFHLLVAAPAALCRVPVDLVPALLNAQALLVLLLALDAAGRRLGLGVPARVGALGLVALGLSPFGWARLLSALSGNPALTWDRVREAGAYGLFPLLSPEDPRLVATLTKIAISNAFPLSLALFLTAVSVPRRSGLRAHVALTVLVAGALYLHLVTGILLVAALGLAWAGARIGGGPEAEGSWGRPLALAAASALFVPYLLQVLGPRESATLDPGPHPGAIRLHVSLIVVWILALAGIRGGSGLRRPVLLALPALALPFTVHLTDGNEYKSVFVLLLLLALPAGRGLARLARRRLAGVLLVLALLLPTPVLVAWTYLRDVPPETPSPAERAALRAASRSLEQDAVLLPLRPDRGFSVRATLLGRPAFLSDAYHLNILGQWRSPEATARRGLLERIGAGDPRALRQAQQRVGGRPLVLLVPAEAASALRRLRVGDLPQTRIGGILLVRIPPGRG